MFRGIAALLVVLAPCGSVLAVDGPTVFRQRCASCHGVAADAPRGPGPKLHGLIGRPVGGDPDFDYSPALEAARETGRRWDRDMLRQFLADPEEMFPGLWMGNNGLRSETERDAVVAFLDAAAREPCRAAPDVPADALARPPAETRAVELSCQTPP
jgi:cytochrome c